MVTFARMHYFHQDTPVVSERTGENLCLPGYSPGACILVKIISVLVKISVTYINFKFFNLKCRKLLQVYNGNFRASASMQV